MCSILEDSDGRFQQLLAGLPLGEREDLLAEAEAILAGSGAEPDEYDAVIAAWLDGAWPPPDDVLHGLLTADELAASDTLPRDDTAPTLSAEALRASVEVDSDGISRLAEGLSDDQVLTWIRRATALEQQAQWLRSVGITSLTARWTTPTDPGAGQPPDALVAGAVGADTDPGRARRLRAVARRQNSPLKSRLGLASPLGEDDRVDRYALAEAFAVTETALACAVSERTAREWQRLGGALVEHAYPLLAAGLAAGRIDWSKIRAISEALADRDPAVQAQVEAIIVPQLELPDPVTDDADPAVQPLIRSIPVLKERIRTLLLLLDPDHETQDVDHERDKRRVHSRLITPYTAELIAVLPVEDVAAIAARLDAAAEHARAARDPRTADQVRADTLVHLLTGHNPAAPVHQPAPAPASAPSDANTANVTDTDTDTDGGTATTAAASAAAPASSATGSRAPSGVVCACGRPAPVPPRGSGVHTTLVMSLDTLIGLTNDPAYLDRYGPIPATLARDLAAKGTFRCAAADDTHGTVLGLGQTTYTPRYRPGQRLHDLTRATWRHCSFPGCRNRAIKSSQCELDHGNPWPAGPTCSCNIHPLCKRHHQAKTHGHIVLEPSQDPADPPGTLHWRLPSGRTYPSRPDPMILDRRLVEPHSSQPGPDRTIYTDPDEPPPF